MKIPILLILLLNWYPIHAQEASVENTKSCNFQSRELALRTQQEIFPDMTAEQRFQLMALTTEVCLSHVETSQPITEAPQQNENTEDKGSSWFSDLFNSDMDGGKKGNERLRKR